MGKHTSSLSCQCVLRMWTICNYKVCPPSSEEWCIVSSLILFICIPTDRWGLATGSCSCNLLLFSQHSVCLHFFYLHVVGSGRHCCWGMLSGGGGWRMNTKACVQHEMNLNKKCVSSSISCSLATAPDSHEGKLKVWDWISRVMCTFTSQKGPTVPAKSLRRRNVSSLNEHFVTREANSWKLSCVWQEENNGMVNSTTGLPIKWSARNRS